MIEYAFFLSVCLFILGALLLYILKVRSQNYGVLKHTVTYSDSDKKPGVSLYAKSVKLVGRPDFIIEKDGLYHPVEYKSRRAPAHPFRNHTMQLMAYCLLIEENFHTPPGGFVKYEDKEFYIEYTPQDKQEIQLLVQEILQKKQLNIEPFCPHPAHN